MVDTARVGWIKNFNFLRAIVGLNDNRKIAFRNLHAGRSIAIDAHRSQVNDMRVMTAGVDNGAQQVVGSIEVISHGVPHFLRAFHRIGRRALLGEMDDRRRPLIFQQLDQLGIVSA